MKNVSIWLKINFADSSLKNKLEWEQKQRNAFIGFRSPPEFARYHKPEWGK